MGLIELINKLGQSSSSKRPQIYKQIANTLSKDSLNADKNDSQKEVASFFNHSMTDLKEGNNDLRQVVITSIPAVLNRNAHNVFLKEQRLDIIKYIISLINAEEEPTIVIKCIWCLNQMPSFKYDEEMIKDILHGFEAVISIRSKAFVLYFEVCFFFQRLYREYENIVKKFVTIVVKLVFLPLSHPTSKIREIAETTLSMIFPSLLTSQKEIVLVVKKLTKENYLKDLLFLFNQKQEVYVLKVWSRLVSAVGKGLHDGCSLINALLEIVERAFKSSQEDVSVAAFGAWKSLISNYALDARVLGNQKKLKLLLQPFKRNTNFSKKVLAAVCDAWWFLIWNLNDMLDTNFELVCIPLLEFTVRKTLKGAPDLQLAAHKPDADSEAFLLKKGCEVLLRLLEQPSSATFNQLSSPKKMPPLSFAQLQVPIQSSILIKHFESILVASRSIIYAIGNDDKMSNNISCLLKSILSVVTTKPGDCSKESVFVITSYVKLISDIVESKLCSPLLCLKSIDSITKLPRKILVSHLYCLGNIKKIQGNLCSSLLKIMLTPYIFSASCPTQRFSHTYNRLVQAGVHGALYPLDVVWYIIDILTRPYVTNNFDNDALLNLWVSIAAACLEAIKKTQEINQGDIIEHDFSCVCDVLMYPVDHILLRSKYPFHTKVAFELWTNLYNTCNRCASLVVPADTNTFSEDLCTKLKNSIKPDLIQIPEIFGGFSQIVEVVIGSVDYSSCSIISKLGSSSKIFSKQQKKSIGNLTSLVHLLVQLLEVYYLKIIDTDSNKGEKQEPESTWLSQKLTSPLELMKTFFSSIISSAIIPPILQKIAEPLSKYYLITDKNKLTQSFVSNLDALWNSMTTTIQLHYSGPYDTEFLNVITPLLESTFSHSRRTIREKSRKFWFKTFGLSLPTLKFPQNLKNILKKMKLPLMPEMEISPTEEISTLPSSESFTENDTLTNLNLSFNIKGMKVTENKKLNVVSSPKSTGPATPKSSKRKSASKISIDDLPDEEFVKIESPVSSPATNRRGQKRKKSYVPALYNDLSQNGDTFENSTESQNTISNSLPEDPSKNLNERMEESISHGAITVANSKKQDTPKSSSEERPVLTLSSDEDCADETKTSSLIITEKSASENVQDIPISSLDCHRKDNMQKFKVKQVKDSEFNLKNLKDDFVRFTNSDEKDIVEKSKPQNLATSALVEKASKSTIEEKNTPLKRSNQKELKPESHDDIEIIYESEKSLGSNSVELFFDSKLQNADPNPTVDSKLEGSFCKNTSTRCHNQRKSEPITTNVNRNPEKSIFRNLNKSSNDVILIEDSEEVVLSSQSTCGNESAYSINRKSLNCTAEPKKASVLSSKTDDTVVVDEHQNKEIITLNIDSNSGESVVTSDACAINNSTVDISKQLDGSLPNSETKTNQTQVCTSSDTQLSTKSMAVVEDESEVPNLVEPKNEDILSLLHSIVDDVVKNLDQSMSVSLNVKDKSNTADIQHEDKHVKSTVIARSRGRKHNASSESDSSQSSSQNSDKSRSRTSKTSVSKFFEESRHLRSTKGKRLTRNSLGINLVSKSKVHHRSTSTVKSGELPFSHKNVSESPKTPSAKSSDLLKPNVDISRKTKKEIKIKKKDPAETLNSVIKHEELNQVTFIKIEIDSSRRDNSAVSSMEKEKNVKVKRESLNTSNEGCLSKRSDKPQTKPSSSDKSIFKRRSPRKQAHIQSALKQKTISKLAKDLFGSSPNPLANEMVKLTHPGRASCSSSFQTSDISEAKKEKKMKRRTSLPVVISKCDGEEDKNSLQCEINAVLQFVKESNPNVSLSKPIPPLKILNVVSLQNKDAASSGDNKMVNLPDAHFKGKQEVCDIIDVSVPNSDLLNRDECSHLVSTVPDTLQEGGSNFNTLDTRNCKDESSKPFSSEVHEKKELKTDVFNLQSNFKSNADTTNDDESSDTSQVTKSKRGRKPKLKSSLKLVSNSEQTNPEENLKQIQESEQNGCSHLVSTVPDTFQESCSNFNTLDTSHCNVESSKPFTSEVHKKSELKTDVLDLQSNLKRNADATNDDVSSDTSQVAKPKRGRKPKLKSSLKLVNDSEQKNLEENLKQIQESECSHLVNTVPDPLQEGCSNFNTLDTSHCNDKSSKPFLSEVHERNELKTDVLNSQSNLKRNADTTNDDVSSDTSQVAKPKRGRKPKSKSSLKLISNSEQTNPEENLKQIQECEHIADVSEPTTKASEDKIAVVQNPVHIEAKDISDTPNDNSDVISGKNKQCETPDSKLAHSSFESGVSDVSDANLLPKKPKYIPKRKKKLLKGHLKLLKTSTHSRNEANSLEEIEPIIDSNAIRQSPIASEDKILVIQDSSVIEPNAFDYLVKNRGIDESSALSNKDAKLTEHSNVEKPVSKEKINVNISEEHKPVSIISQKISTDPDKAEGQNMEINIKATQEFDSNSDCTTSKKSDNTIPEILNSVLLSLDSRFEFPQFAFNTVTEANCSQFSSCSFDLNSERSFEIPQDEEKRKTAVFETDGQWNEASQGVAPRNEITEIEGKSGVKAIEVPCMIPVDEKKSVELNVVSVTEIESGKTIPIIEQNTNLETDKQDKVIQMTLCETEILEQKMDTKTAGLGAVELVAVGDAVELVEPNITELSKAVEMEQMESVEVNKPSKMLAVDDVQVKPEICPENEVLETEIIDNEYVICEEEIQTISNEKGAENIDVGSFESVKQNNEINDTQCVAHSEALFPFSENSIEEEMDVHVENISEEWSVSVSKGSGEETVFVEDVPKKTIVTEKNKNSNSNDQKHVIDHLYALQNSPNKQPTTLNTSQVDAEEEKATSLESEYSNENVIEINENHPLSEVGESSSLSGDGLSVDSKQNVITECIAHEKDILSQERALESEDEPNNPFILESIQNKILDQKAGSNELSSKSNLCLDHQTKITTENKDHQQCETDLVASEDNTCLEFEIDVTSHVHQASEISVVASTEKTCIELETGVIIHNNDQVSKCDIIASDGLAEQETSTIPQKLEADINAFEDAVCSELEPGTAVSASREYQESQSDLITFQNHASVKPVLESSEKSENALQTSNSSDNISHDGTCIELETVQVHDMSAITSEACQESNEITNALNDSGKPSDSERSDLEDKVVKSEKDAVRMCLDNVSEKHLQPSSSKFNEGTSQENDSGMGSQKRKAKFPVRSPVLLRHRKSGIIVSAKSSSKKKNPVCTQDNKHKTKPGHRNVSLVKKEAQGSEMNQDIPISNGTGFCSETGENETIDKDLPSVSNCLSMKMSPLSRSYKIVQAVRKRDSVTNENVQCKDASSKVTHGDDMRCSESPAIVYPDSPVSTPKRSAIKKRNLDAESFSPLSKRQKVSFADPLVEERVFTIADGKRLNSTKNLVSCLKGSRHSRKRIFAACESSTSKNEPPTKLTKEKNNTVDMPEERLNQCESNQSEVIPQGTNASADKELPSSSSEYEDSETLPYESSVRKSPICPVLEDCKHPIFKITGDLTSSTWVKGLNKLLTKMKILTIGDLCKMSVEEVKALPIKSPKVENVHNALCNYLKQSQAETLNTSKCLGPYSDESNSNILQCDETISSESELGFEEEETKKMPESENIEDKKEKMMEDLLKCEHFNDVPVQILSEIAKRCIDSLTSRSANS